MSHKYIPNQISDQKKMLEVIGLTDLDALFSSIPKGVRLGRSLHLDKGLNEIEVTRRLKKLSDMNQTSGCNISFLGAGIYDHHIPSVIDSLVSRSEFYTSYTPYQPEISQGTLQAIYEYQSAMCELTGMDVSNASMYDGASALYEACALSVEHTKINRIILFSSIHPEYIEVVKTGMNPHETMIDLAANKDELNELIKTPAACIVIQTPDFLGSIHDLSLISEVAMENKCLSIAVVDPISLGLLEAPGNLGIDIAVGDGQSLGNYANFGGPHFGFFCTTTKLMRKIPGRIVGKTTDAKGNDGYVLTLQAREQHIRREKASSNICSNHSLCALRGLIFLCVAGKQGLHNIALDCANKSQYLKDGLLSTGYFTDEIGMDHFKEFALKTDLDIDNLNEELLKRGYIGGLNIQEKNYWLLAVTEKRTYDEIDQFIKEVKDICDANH